jgi:hypothetical protein
VAVVAAVLWSPVALTAAAVAVMGVVTLATVDALRARRSLAVPTGHRHAALVGVLGVLQPLARWWGRNRRSSRTPFAPASPCRPLVRHDHDGRLPVDQVVLVEDRPRAEVTAAVIEHLRLHGVRVLGVAGWEDHDGEIVAGGLCSAQLQTSGHPAGLVHARIRMRPRWRRVAFAVAAGCLAAAVAPPTVLYAIAVVTGGDVLRGLRRVARARWHLHRVGH